MWREAGNHAGQGHKTCVILAGTIKQFLMANCESFGLIPAWLKRKRARHNEDEPLRWVEGSLGCPDTPDVACQLSKGSSGCLDTKH